MENAPPRRDTLAILFSLGGITLLCWIYLFKMASDMTVSMPMNTATLQIQIWTGDYFIMMFLMWAIMMVGMMLPSVIPMVLIYTAVARKSAAQGTPVADTGFFVLGYLFMWIVFSFLATAAQYGLDRWALLSPMMVSTSPYLGAALLIAAGVYQWLPAKDRCLEHCRSPVHFISNHWQQGRGGAFGMGIRHGFFCVGCCWLLMCLLFVGGVMNLLWIGLITLYVLLEKILPFGRMGGRVAGIAIIAASFYIIF